MNTAAFHHADAYASPYFDETFDVEPVLARPAVAPVAVMSPSLLAAPVRRAKPKKKRLLLTAGDKELLFWMARHRIVTVAQISRRFGRTESGLRRRLPQLERAGLVTWACQAATAHKVWHITSEGLKAIDLALPTPSVKWGVLRHTLGLVDLLAHFELHHEIVITEAEIRTSIAKPVSLSSMDVSLAFVGGQPTVDPRDAARNAFTVKVPGRVEAKIPDACLVRTPFPSGASGVLFVELELSRKTQIAWETTVRAYDRAPNVAGVYYYTDQPSIYASLLSAVKRTGATKVNVSMWKAVDDTADPYRGRNR
jgi:hypothetical protein